MLNKLFGFGLVAAAMLIGVHSCGDDFSKTNIAITITHAPPVVAEKVAELSDKAMASLELKFKPCPIYSQDVPLPKAKPTVSSKKKSVSKKIYFSKKKVHHVYKFILPNEFKSDMKFSYEQQRHSRSCPSGGFRPEGCAGSFAAWLVDGESSRYSNPRYPISELHAARQTEQGFSLGSSQPSAKWSLVRTGAHQSRELRGLRGQAAQKGVVRGPRSSDRKVSRVSVRRVQSHSWGRAGRSETALQANLISKTKPMIHHRGGHYKHHSSVPSHGHGHSGPQKIPAHGTPPHLTGPPGCT